MSVTIPTEFQDGQVLNLAAMGANELVLLENWKAMAQEQNGLWAKSGFKCSSPFLETPWQTTSTSYATTNGNGDFDLDMWLGLGLAVRPVEVSGSLKCKVQLVTYARNLTVKAQFYKFDESTGLFSSLSGWTPTTIHDDDSEWITDTDEQTQATCHQGGSTANPLAIIACAISAKVTDGGTGYLWSWGVRDTIAESADSITTYY